MSRPFSIPHPEDFAYKEEVIDNAKRMTREELQEEIKHLVLELRGTRRSLRMAMTPKPEPYGRFTVLKGRSEEDIANSGIHFRIKTPIDIRVEVWKLGQDAVLDKLAELPDK